MHLDRRKAVEFDRGVACRVGAGGKEIDGVTDLEIEWQIASSTLIQNVDAVTSWAGRYRRFRRPVVYRWLNAVLNAFAEGFGKPVVTTGVEVDPAAACASRFVRDQQDLRAEQAGIANRITARLNHDLGPGLAKKGTTGRKI